MKSWILFAGFAGLAVGCGRQNFTTTSSAVQTSNALSTQSSSPSGPPWFSPVPASSGFDFQHRSGRDGHYYFPEIETGGVGLIDYDGDGLLDVICIDGGALNPAATQPPRHRLYHNLGNWKFADVTAESGLVCTEGYGMGCAAGDYDGDGRPDIYITQVGSNHLFRNNGNGTFTDVTEKAGVGVHAWSTSACFFDYDGDGLLDLAVVNYVRWTPAREEVCYSAGGRRDYCSPLNYRAPTPMVLFHNRGDGTFEDVSEKAGLRRGYGNGFGITTGDFDHDGRVDMYVANDATPNQLWLNRGNGQFIDDAPLRGCSLNSVGIPRAGMGVVAVDVMQNGWLDLFVTHLVGEGNGLFRNQQGNFADWVSPEGPMAGSTPFTGFGVTFADFNNDGLLDLYVANGRVRLGGQTFAMEDPYAEPNCLLQGLGPDQFREVHPRGGTSPVLLGTSRGLAVGDLDNDGKVDLVIINKDGPAHLLRNITDSKAHWIRFDFRTFNNLEVRNAVVRLEAGGRSQWRQSQPNEGYCSSQDPRVHFGLGNSAMAEHVYVRWPDGRAEDFGPRSGDATHRIEKGTGKAVPGAFSW